MTMAAPWSVKGIDPKAREVAKELARRSGMTLGEWLNRVILEDDLPEEITSEEHFTTRPFRAAPEPAKSDMAASSTSSRPDDLGRIAFALDRLTDRIEASETRTGLAISGVEHSVRHAMARIETAEREHLAVATRFESVAEQLTAEQATASDRMRWVEAELSGPRSAEAINAIEASITRVAGQVAEGADQTRETLLAIQARLGRAESRDPAEAIRALEASLAEAAEQHRESLAEIEARIARTEGRDPAAAIQALEGAVAEVANSMAEVAGQLSDGTERTRSTLAGLEERLARAEGQDPAAIVQDIVASLGQRLADAEARTGEALDSLRDSLMQLDQRMYATDSSVRGDLDNRLEALADQLTRRVEDARSELAQRLAATGASSSGQIEARLGQMAEEMAAVEQRSARAIETMGREVLTMAETLNRRVQSAEQRSAQAIEQVGGEIARIAGAVESRLGRTDQLHAEALERLGAEIGKITDRLTDRIIQSERRAAQAIDDVGEQVARVTERIEQRHERAAGDLAERIRQSEERTARLLDDSHARLANAAANAPAGAAIEAAAADQPQTELPAAPLVFGAELFSRAEPVSQPALDPSNPAFDEEDFAHVDAFAPTHTLDAGDDFAPLSDIEAEDEDRVEPAADIAAVADIVAIPAPQDAPALSTREVIEQARAAARAAAAAPKPKAVYAGERRPRSLRTGGMFGALKPGRPTSTWQTVLMVAGGAAFLSVGAAGVVLMEGPGSGHHDPLQLDANPRAAVALAPDALAPVAAVLEAPPAPAATEPTAATAADAASTDYAKVVAAVQRKEPGALTRLKTIADSGNASAQMFLARLYETGQDGVTQNIGEARRWTARAADAGDPTAMHNLALFYFRGEGAAPDTATAAQWFKKAAEHGIVDSQYNLGLLYQSGSGVPRDLAQAYKWFTIAANAGDGEARTSAMDLQSKLQPGQLASAESQATTFQPATDAATPQSLGVAPSVVAAQKILGRLGYYKGRPDGANSRDLKIAVSAYQRDQGLNATGALDPTTVSRLAVFSR